MAGFLWSDKALQEYREVHGVVKDGQAQPGKLLAEQASAQPVLLRAVEDVPPGSNGKFYMLQAGNGSNPINGMTEIDSTVIGVNAVSEETILEGQDALGVPTYLPNSSEPVFTLIRAPILRVVKGTVAEPTQCQPCTSRSFPKEIQVQISGVTVEGFSDLEDLINQTWTLNRDLQERDANGNVVNVQRFLGTATGAFYQSGGGVFAAGSCSRFVQRIANVPASFFQEGRVKERLKDENFLHVEIGIASTGGGVFFNSFWEGRVILMRTPFPRFDGFGALAGTFIFENARTQFVFATDVIDGNNQVIDCEATATMDTIQNTSFGALDVTGATVTVNP